MENTTTTAASEPTQYGSSNERENNLDDPLAKNITAGLPTLALSKGKIEKGFPPRLAERLVLKSPKLASNQIPDFAYFCGGENG